MTQPALAFVGLGAMGSGMAHRLLAAGYPMTVHNRTAARASSLVEAGARLAASAAEAVPDAEIVILSLSDDDAVEQTLFNEITGSLKPGATIVDTTAVSPAYARQAASRLEAMGLVRVEAAVVGNPGMAKAGKLRVLTAGPQEPSGPVRQVLESIGESVLHVGATGAASALKLCFNLLLGAHTAALAEAVSYGDSVGIDKSVVIDALAASGFSSPALSFRASFMRDGTYEPAAFRSSLMAKDLRNAITDASQHEVSMPVIQRVADRFAEIVRAGHGDCDAAVILRQQENDKGHNRIPVID
ncbi:NAD(P)-dependent oxidoreductase [Kibdelosporangium phytohabitans]|uniref:3-hydroxyisobutyrate dehydrogenase n=1 Tax=Kibdelosporangium phytohabitans TaxID=860235 RepID=A0A0N7F4A9_9PSEU|nr:NAD(P)-dependent oxidoreductase [Kibdelosporangium phytohabitans]ALG10919.1 3-hydroxyisobutyrate dehydrogenase [Kibdelosporangium phytohabitans]MBE1462110.1 3-hydroxyisobutyrate dehydrogenase [Kibdelosporangium phytohabitans]